MNIPYIHRIREYIKFRLRSQSVQNLHSPFVFDFYQNVLKKKYSSKKIETIRKDLKASDEIIDILDLGAGSSVQNTSRRKISDIARLALKSPRYAGLIHNIIEYYSFEDVIELGTSLGITTLYMQEATARPVITIEGSPAVRKKAEEVFNSWPDPRPKLLLGNFDDILPDVLDDLRGNFILYIDGNHTYEATMRYFHLSMKYAAPYSLIIFDDIYWSAEMTKAWKEIISDDIVPLSIDLYQLGLIFLNPDILEKQNFTFNLGHKV